MTIRDLKPLITGFGGVTGAGDEAAFRAMWLEGKSSVRPFEGSKHEGLPPGYGAAANFIHKDLRGLPGGKGLRPGTMTTHTFLAVGGVGRALHQAGLHDPAADADSIADRRREQNRQTVGREYYADSSRLTGYGRIRRARSSCIEIHHVNAVDLLEPGRFLRQF